MARDPRYIVIPADSVAAQLARSRTTSDIARNLDVELFTSFQISAFPDSSVVWQLTLRDLGANGAFGTRAVAMRTQPPDHLARIDSLIESAARFLKEMDRAPRRSPPRTGGREG
jgi:hypothetical protein